MTWGERGDYKFDRFMRPLVPFLAKSLTPGNLVDFVQHYPVNFYKIFHCSAIPDLVVPKASEIESLSTYLEPLLVWSVTESKSIFYDMFKNELTSRLWGAIVLSSANRAAMTLRLERYGVSLMALQHISELLSVDCSTHF